MKVSAALGVLAFVWNTHSSGNLLGSEGRPEVSHGVPLGFQCLTEFPISQSRTALSDRPQLSRAQNGFQQIRSYRLAIAASGEYSEFHGGTTATAMSAITNLVQRLNEIYQPEMGIQFLLVTNNSLVVYLDKNTDPFTSNSPAAITLDEAQKALDEKIGNNNYDLGILLNTGTYGLAVLSSVCDSKFKGSACMGLPQPDGEMFSIFVAHEIAHQFGATHTFNDNTGFCSGNRSPGAAVEPGTGSTLLSYAGLGCGSTNLQPFMDHYFHAQSIEEMETFIADTTLCGTVLVTSNHVPMAFAGPDHIIPKLTPFKLTARGSDAEDDSLTFCWEELDLGPPQTFADSDNGSSPLFRSFPPETNAFRVFPKMDSILQNTNSPGEQLPALSRVMHFRVTVRDGQQMGAKGFADTYVEVAGSSGPFRLTSHNTPGVFRGEQTIRWNVAGTAEGPINATRVNLLLSTNGGEDFTIVLAAHTPNDGAKNVTFPNINCSNARIKIEAEDNIFFDVNSVDFTIATIPVFTRIEPVADGVSVRWTRAVGKNYELQTTSTLENPDWQIVNVPLVTEGNEMEATVSTEEGAAFFRVREF